MQKQDIPFIIIIILLLVGGYFFYQNQKAVSPTPSESETSTAELGSMSAQEILASEEGIRCQLENSDGNTYTAFFKDNKVRTETQEEVGVVVNIFKEGIRWAWAEEKSKGFVFDQASIQKEFNNVLVSKEKVAESASESLKSCQAFNVADSQFRVPEDIEFQEMDSVEE